MGECVEEVLERVNVVEMCHDKEFEIDGEIEKVILRFGFRHCCCHYYLILDSGVRVTSVSALGMISRLF